MPKYSARRTAPPCKGPSRLASGHVVNRRQTTRTRLAFFPSPVGRGFKERDLIQRAFFARDSRFRLRKIVTLIPGRDPVQIACYNLSKLWSSSWKR